MHSTRRPHQGRWWSGALVLAGACAAPVLATTASSASVTGQGRSVPSEITGTHEVLHPAPPGQLGGEVEAPGKVVAGTEHGFTVDGTPTFVVADVTPRSSPSGPPGATGLTSGSTLTAPLEGDSGGGTSFLGRSPKGVVLRGSPVQILADWPTPGKQLYVWTHLPKGTAFVTYSYKGATLAWQSPVSGTIALLVPRPAAFDGDYATWHSAPLPLLRAYDTAGHLVTKLDAPRIANDDLKVGSSPPAKGQQPNTSPTLPTNAV